MAKAGLFGDPLFPNVTVRIVTKGEHFCENQKLSSGPKIQNEPLFFSSNKGFLFGENSELLL